MSTPSLPLDLRQELGSGTTGRVRAAVLKDAWEELPEGLEIALKRLSPELAADPARRRAFGLEAEVAIRLRDPGLVRGYAHGEDAEGHWLALQYVPGPTLREMLDESGALPEPQVREIGTSLSGAVSTLAGAGYLHGDLKPENVRLDEDGRAVLLDLGFVRPLRDPEGGEDPATPVHRVAGSPAYLSPEEARGGLANEKSECFSLGILLYELASGRHPFLDAGEGIDASTALRALAEPRYRQASLLVPTLSPFLDVLLGEMLTSSAEDRPYCAQVHRRLVEQESGVWWRSQLDLHQAARRSNRPVRTDFLLPLVGRERALARLLGAARLALPRAPEASSASGGVVELGGAEGSGRSRLMQEFATLARRVEDPPIYLYARSRQFEEQRPCQPILTLLHRYLQLPPSTMPGRRERAVLDDLLPREERDTLIDALTPAFEGTTPVPVPVALGAWLTALASRSPLIVYLDDLDWADESTLSVLIRLVDQLPGLALLLVLGIRADVVPRRAEVRERLRERLAGLDFHEEIQLEPLGESEVLTLVEQLFSPAVPRLRLARVLWERSRGNPGMIAELLRSMRERGESVPGPDGLDLSVHPEDLPLPASLRGALTESYKLLGPQERSWLSRLAVTGGRIQARFLLRAWPDENLSELDQALTVLTHSGWLVPVDNRYRFRRPAMRQVIYKNIPAEERREMHAEVARALRPTRGGRLSIVDAFQRAFHLRAAERYPELLRILRPLLGRVADRGQPPRVFTLANWGLEALGKLTPTPERLRLQVEFLMAGADAADRIGYREQQRQLLDELSGLDIDPSADPEIAGNIYLLHARYSINTGQYGSARSMLRNAAQWFEQAGSMALLSDSLRRWSLIQGHVGELAEARRLARRAWETSPTPLLKAGAEHALGVVEILENRVESALRHTDRCMILLRQCEGPQSIAVRAQANSLRGRVYRGAGRPRRAIGSAQRSLRDARRSGDRQLEVDLLARLGIHLLDLDRVEEAESTLREALLLARDIEDRRGECYAALFLGILLAESNDPTADVHLNLGIERAREMGQGRVEAVGLAIQSRRRYWHSPAEALRASDRAVALVERNGAELIDRIVIVGNHAVILDASGRQEEAAELIKALRKRMRIENAHIESPLLKRRQRLASTRLLQAVLVPEGPLYRRVRLDR